ncbi:hypothetical protein [Pantoea agglomerans]|uniref:hypothetical protein n=1 Tax=Enterobacter agglomerans TaxID=549 RepID=UPI0010C1E6F3|nr:hypothetical protein [Pantoea agglomerans]MBD8144886.1 hypothetical protein [Pantoea agglomerans]MBD8181132.1 hypothetical protein [Pantoea agglomerans]MBD8222670.1 hypothetical protein [Pantoea agglomerans]TKJ56230.1 hypothetical protein PagCFBP13505_13450 [Pantoea agglomerans]TKK35358.1 hypothetical protein PagCFBP13532_11015 [Pantoea agglomerans]
MTRALLLAIGLSIAGSAFAGSINGSIGARLVIYSRCEIYTANGQPAPQINCGRQASAQPRVTNGQIQSQGSVKQSNRLVTIEW